MYVTRTGSQILSRTVVKSTTLSTVSAFSLENSASSICVFRVGKLHKGKVPQGSSNNPQLLFFVVAKLVWRTQACNCLIVEVITNRNFLLRQCQFCNFRFDFCWNPGYGSWFWSLNWILRRISHTLCQGWGKRTSSCWPVVSGST